MRARRFKHQFGGAMRQAGIVAAACVYALDHNVDRLAEDHARARRLAEALHEAGVPVDLERVETNFVQLDVGSMGLDDRRRDSSGCWRGRAASRRRSTRGCSGAVTHLGIGDEDIDHASEAIPRALGGGAQPDCPR